VNIPPGTPLVCYRIADLRFPRVDSDLDHCAICHAAVWRALSSPAGTTVWCWQCALPLIDGFKEKGEPVEAVVTEAQLADIAALREREGLT